MGPEAVELAVEQACAHTAAWLRELSGWPNHPTNLSGSVSSHFGPTILSEHDCVLHLVRHLHAAGIPWENMHLEFSPARWMFNVPTTGASRPKRIDLAIVDRDRLKSARLPTDLGTFRFDAVIEFALASDYWKYGAGSKNTAQRKIKNDIAKVAEYIRTGIAEYGYVIVIEEIDHAFPKSWNDDIDPATGVRTRVLRRWC